MTTNWVLAREFEGFPLMYHWRVLPDSTPLHEELADVEKTVAYWGGDARVRRRLQALEQSSASIAFFLEYIPHSLHHWLTGRLETGGRSAGLACAMVEREVKAGTAFINARGLLHFDAHFENLLTDGRRLYFADYGLAISSRFELSPDEAEFFARHESYDRCYTLNHLVNWLVVGLRLAGMAEREERIRAYAAGERPAGIPEEAAAILVRHAPVAAVMSAFLRGLRQQSRDTPYPLEEFRGLGVLRPDPLDRDPLGPG